MVAGTVAAAASETATETAHCKIQPRWAAVSRIGPRGGVERQTSRRSSEIPPVAPEKWIEDAKPTQIQQRLQSDFLCYRNDDGLYADFHSLRHLFRDSLARAGVSPKTTQELVRHSDIRLTWASPPTSRCMTTVQRSVAAGTAEGI